MNRRTLILVGAAVLATALAGIAYLVLHGARADPVRLRATLDAYTGEWEGDASIQASAGRPLQTLRVTRRYSWVGDKQIVETLFVLGAEEHALRAIQWIDGGLLQAVETGPGGEPHTFSGALTLDGILWTNLQRPKSDRLDRLVTDGGRTTVQSASFVSLSPGHGAEYVGMAVVLFPRSSSTPSALAGAGYEAESGVRAAELERKLAVTEQEREELRARLAQIELARADPRPPDPRIRPSQLEIRSSPPGLKFEVRAENERNVIAPTILSSGTTPVTLTTLAPGNYAVILQRNGQRKTVHHVAVSENVDVFLFHREDGGTDGALTTAGPSGEREFPATSAP